MMPAATLALALALVWVWASARSESRGRHKQAVMFHFVAAVFILLGLACYVCYAAWQGLQNFAP